MAKLSRKNFFKGLALGTISLPFVIRGCGGENLAQQSSSANVITGKNYEWKMVTTWPPNFPVFGEGCTLFAKIVEEMSAGRMKIKVYGGGELVPPLESFDAVRSGAANIGHGAAYYWAGKSPAAQFFAAVPFGMNAQQMNSWISNGGGLALWEELYAEFGLVPMVAGNSGVQMGGWFNKEINALEDLEGLKMRIPGLGGKVLEKAGGAPVLLAGGELYTGLERGIIDATEWVGPYHDYKMGFHQIAKYYYTPGWHETGTTLELFFNKKDFDALDNSLKAIFRAAAAKVNSWILYEFETQNAIYLDKLIREENVDIRNYPKEVLDQLRIYTDEVVAELVESDPFAERVYASYQDFRQKATVWSKVTEKVFYNDIQI